MPCRARNKIKAIVKIRRNPHLWILPMIQKRSVTITDGRVHKSSRFAFFLKRAGFLSSTYLSVENVSLSLLRSITSLSFLQLLINQLTCVCVCETSFLIYSVPLSQVRAFVFLDKIDIYLSIFGNAIPCWNEFSKHFFPPSFQLVFFFITSLTLLVCFFPNPLPHSCARSEVE